MKNVMQACKNMLPEFELFVLHANYMEIVDTQWQHIHVHDVKPLNLSVIFEIHPIHYNFIM
jgi:uncharacterized protein YjaG (DUF416 family)